MRGAIRSMVLGALPTSLPTMTAFAAEAEADDADDSAVTISPFGLGGGGFVFMPIPSFGVDLNPARFVKIGFTTQFLYAVAESAAYWGFGGSIWLAFGQIWPAA
jgi:hypothetical protein